MNQSRGRDHDDRADRIASGNKSEEPKQEEPSGHDDSVAQSRRWFLRHMTNLMGTAITGVMAFVFAGYTLFPIFKRISADDWTDVGPIDEIPDEEAIKRAVVISQDGGWGRFNSQQLVWIVRNRDNVVVYSAACPHLGCTINAAERGFICPCHGSAWNRDGSKVGGPTPRAMDTLEYRIDDGVLQVKYRFFRQGVSDKQVIA
jgi:Rieske Fe-S protein